MEVRIIDAAGAAYALPQLLRWEVSHGFCSPCDSFEAAFLYDAGALDALRAAVRLQACFEGETVFAGIVDEVEARADGSGAFAIVRGRGMQALLLDSEAESADYYNVDADFVLDKHARSFGVTDIDFGGCAGKRASLSVRSGESHWSVVQRFAEFCLGTQPRFTPQGRLLLDGAHSGRSLTIDDKIPVTAQSFVQERYGVVRRAIVINRALGARTVVENADFAALGGMRERVVNVPRKTGFDAMRHSGVYQITRSGRDFVRCRLTLPQCFAAFPGDTVLLDNSPLGVRGEFFADASRSFANGADSGTVLELRQRYAPALENG